MIELLLAIIEQLLQSSLLELIAVLFAIAYLALAVRENSLCWYAAGISTLIFLFIFFGTLSSIWNLACRFIIWQWLFLVGISGGVHKARLRVFRFLDGARCSI